MKLIAKVYEKDDGSVYVEYARPLVYTDHHITNLMCDAWSRTHSILVRLDCERVAKAKEVADGRAD